MCMCPVPKTVGILHPLDTETTADGVKRYICGEKFKWNKTLTSNLGRHVQKMHHAEWVAGQNTSQRTQAYKQKKMQGLQTVTGGMTPGAQFTSEWKKKLRKLQVLWCAWNLRPPNMLADEGFILVSSFLNAQSATITKFSHESFSTLLAELCFEEMSRIKKLIAGVFQTFPRAVGPVFSGQLDGWTAKDTTAFWAFSISWMDENFCRQRVGIAFSQFPGSHTANRVVDWIKEVTQAFFDKTPREVFVALTTDGGSNLTDLERRLGIYRHQCDGHLLNTVVSWSVGKAGTKDTEDVYDQGGDLIRAGTVGTCEHKEMLPLLKAVKTVVKHFQRSSSANETLQAIQRNFEVENPDGYSEALKVLRPVLANDTRWTSNYDMLVRMIFF